MQLKISPEKLSSMIRQVYEDSTMPKVLLPTIVQGVLYALCYIYTVTLQRRAIGDVALYYTLYSLSIEALSQTFVIYSVSLVQMLDNIEVQSATTEEDAVEHRQHVQLLHYLLFGFFFISNALLAGLGVLYFDRVYMIYFTVRMLSQVFANMGISFSILIGSEHRHIAGFGRAILESFIFLACEELGFLFDGSSMHPQMVRQIVVALFNCTWIQFMLQSRPFLDVIYRDKAGPSFRQAFSTFKTKAFQRFLRRILKYALPFAGIFSSFSLVILLNFTVLGIDESLEIEVTQLFVFYMSFGVMNVGALSVMQTFYPRVQILLIKRQGTLAAKRLVSALIISTITVSAAFIVMFLRPFCHFVLGVDAQAQFAYGLYQKTLLYTFVIALLDQVTLFAAGVSCILRTHAVLLALALSRVLAILVVVLCARLIVGKRVSPFFVLLPFEASSFLISCTILIASYIQIKHSGEL